ncbi:ABC transporter permease [Herbiconiux sp. P17]|uniref:ABC transporter permease n=1 Tax=Herbiconiux wuyangfengii TaxID=3342794 RepID=UPI0035B6AD6C
MSELAALLRQRIRRDRLQLIFWIGGTALLALFAASAVATTYGDAVERDQILALAIQSPAILILRGLPQGGGLDAFVFFEIFTYLALLAAMMSTFLAVRHTRAEEESGRAELIGSTPAARVLPTVATLVHGVGANILIGLGVFAGLALGGMAVDGSLVAGVATTVTGIVFLAIGMLAAQFMRTSRGANGLSMALVGLAFLLRGVGDALGTQTGPLSMVSAWPSWLSPIGWAQHTAAYTENTLAPLLLSAALAATCLVAVFVLQGVRDSGASLIPERRGRASAGATLSSSFGLAWRLQWGTILGWSVGGAAFGLLAGSLSSLVQQAAASDPSIQQSLQSIVGSAGSMTQTLVAAMFSFVGVLAAACATQAVIRMRQEEALGTAELVLSSPVSRVRWLVDYLVLGLVAIAIVLAASAGVAALSLAASGDGAVSTGDVFATAAAQLPAALIYLGVLALLFVLVPKAAIAAGWAFVAVGVVVGNFGGLIGMPDWLRDVSPFTHTPVITGATTDWSGAVWMAAIAVVAVGASVVLMRRRELSTA